jgi:hypothetical protein
VATAAIHQLRRPGVQAGLLAGAGAVLFVGSMSRFELADQAAADRDLQFMTDVTWKPPLAQDGSYTASTDRGRPVAVHRPAEARTSAEVTAAEQRVIGNVQQFDGVIRTGPATDIYNCHGWVFTGGRFWINPEDIATILEDNDYQPVTDPRPGDIVIYREGDRITHTGLVRTGDNGQPLLVESKWGWMGQFLHPPAGTCYGRAFSFYRSPRRGHTLAGLESPPTPAGAVAGGD